MWVITIYLYYCLTLPACRNTQTLTDEQNLWIKTSTEKIYQLIRETPPDGETFAKTVEHILEREEYWNRWKNSVCPDFEKKPTDTETGKKLTKRFVSVTER